jgi:hypothetical protein
VGICDYMLVPSGHITLYWPVRYAAEGASLFIIPNLFFERCEIGSEVPQREN